MQQKLTVYVYLTIIAPTTPPLIQHPEPAPGWEVCHGHRSQSGTWPEDMRGEKPAHTPSQSSNSHLSDSARASATIGVAADVANPLLLLLLRPPLALPLLLNFSNIQVLERMRHLSLTGSCEACYNSITKTLVTNLQPRSLSHLSKHGFKMHIAGDCVLSACNRSTQ